MKKAILALIGLVVLSGCRLVIEKKSLLVSVPPESDEVNLYYVFEGISLLDKNKWAKSDLDAMRLDRFEFLPHNAEHSLLELCEFEDLRFFLDPSRKRQLCADRRMTIRNRTEFEKLVNQGVSEAIRTSFMKLNFDRQAIKDEITRFHSEAVKSRPAIKALFGPIPFLDYMEGLLEIVEEYDEESITQLINASQEDFRWLRFEPDSVQLVLPATFECSRRIATDPSSIEWLKMIRTSIFPIELLSRDDGLVIELGAKEDVIRLSYTDNRPHAPEGESRVVQLAEGPKPIIVNGKAETADSLVAQFILEKTGFRTWNDVTGRFSVTAKFGGVVDGKVVLLKKDGSKAHVAREQLGSADQNFLDVLTK